MGEESIKEEQVKDSAPVNQESEENSSLSQMKESPKVETRKPESRKPEVKTGDSKEKVQKPASEEDEDIKLDFSAITNIFKGKKAQSSVTQQNQEKKQDKKQEKEHEKRQGNKKEKDDEDLSLDSKAIDSVKDFTAKYWTYLLILIPIFIVIFVRSQATSLAITDDWAQSSVHNYLQNQMAMQERLQNPNLPAQYLQQRVDQKVADYEKQNQASIGQNVQMMSSQLKDFFQYESGSSKYPYMGDIDSYYWLRFARNLDQKGFYGDVKEGNVMYDTYTVAPDRLPVGPSLHPYIILINYKVLKVFSKDMTMMQAQILVPTILAVIAAVLIFLMMNRTFGPLAGLISSVIISVSPIFLSRSLGSDTDIYNVFFPVLIMFFIFEALMSKDRIKKALFASLSGISIGIYSFAWMGWWYLFDFIVIAIVADFVFHIIKDTFHKKKISFDFIFSEKAKNSGMILVCFLVCSFVSLMIAGGFAYLQVPVTAPFAFMHSKEAANPTLWPNVLTTVAEFNSASLSDIMGQMLGPIYFILALLGFVFLAFKDFDVIRKNLLYFAAAVLILLFIVSSFGKSMSPMFFLILLFIPFLIGIFVLFKSNSDHDITLAVLFFIWIAASIYAALEGVRFTLLLVTPVGIGIGITLGVIYDWLVEWMSTSFHIVKIITGIVLFLLMCLILIAPVQAGIQTARQYVPNVDDQWWNALTKINNSSKSDAIINSWWDFGHWFKYIADRGVTLDGSSQNSPQLHWLGKILLTSDDNEARGILRMLDCGANKAFDTIDKKIGNSLVSKRLLDRIILLDRDSAKKVLLASGFSDSEAESVLKYSHCNPPEDFFITSEDMIGKGGVWAHFGSWSFDKAWMHQTFDSSKSQQEFIQKVTKELNITDDAAKDYYNQISNLADDRAVNDWIAPWPSYIQDLAPCQNDSSTVTCILSQQKFSVNVVVNISTMESIVITPDGNKYLDAFGYNTDDGMVTKAYDKNTVGIGMLLIKTDKGYSSVFMSPSLVNSTFTKLYYLDGHGTRYFQPFDSTTGLNGFEVKVWKVKWTDDTTLIVDKYVPHQGKSLNASSIEGNFSRPQASTSSTTTLPPAATQSTSTTLTSSTPSTSSTSSTTLASTETSTSTSTSTSTTTTAPTTTTSTSSTSTSTSSSTTTSTLP